MAGLVNARQQTSFATPVNGDALDASVVLSNDNTLRATYNGHDSDATIHVQSSALASRPAAGTAQRVWVTTDGLRVYIDNGSSWDEIAYARSGADNAFTVKQTITVTTEQLRIRYDASNYYTTTVSVAGAVTFDAVGASSAFFFSDAVTVNSALAVVRTTGNQLSLQYDGSNKCDVTVDLAGAVTFDAVGASAGFTFSDAVTVSGTLTATTLAGTLSTAAQANVTSVGTLTSLTLTASTGAITWNGQASLLSTTSGNLRVRYDASNYLNIDLSATGDAIIKAVGTTPFLQFNNGAGSPSLYITSPGSVVVGNKSAALATNATDGFLYIPTCAGAPSGTPTSQTGTVAVVCDTTNNFLYVYNGAWKKAALV